MFSFNFLLPFEFRNASVPPRSSPTATAHCSQNQTNISIPFEQSAVCYESHSFIVVISHEICAQLCATRMKPNKWRCWEDNSILAWHDIHLTSLHLPIKETKPRRTRCVEAHRIEMFVFGILLIRLQFSHGCRLSLNGSDPHSEIDWLLIWVPPVATFVYHSFSSSFISIYIFRFANLFLFYLIWLKMRRWNERNTQIESIIKRKFARPNLRFCITCRSVCAPLLLKPYFVCSAKEGKRNSIPNSKWTNSCFIIQFINHFVFGFLNWKCEERGGYKIGNGQCAPRKSSFCRLFSLFFGETEEKICAVGERSDKNMLNFRSDDDGGKGRARNMLYLL